MEKIITVSGAPVCVDGKIKWCKGAFTILFVLFSMQTFAQFTVIDNFKTSNVDNNLVFGGSPNPAILTSGTSDPINDGWLRVTNSMINQTGFAYVKSAFPSTLGVLVDFEYKSWRSVIDNTYHGADGFSVFLYNADSVFSTGGYGGSLGYAPNTASVPSAPRGLAGGYLGVGLDEYGNFSNATEGRNGGPGLRPNSIVLRGPTTNNAATTNAYLAGYQINADPSVDGVDYNTTTSTRPTDAQFYRRVQFEVTPVSGVYIVTLKLKTSVNGVFTTLLTYTMTTPPPANLRVGFAATTGGGVNYHEVRNLIITTPGNARVDKRVDKSNAPILDQVTYTINAYNNTSVALNGVILADTLKDGNGVPLPLSPITFSISGITFNNNGNAGNTASGGYISGTAKTSGFTNPFTTTLNLAPNSYATFTIVGTVQGLPAGGVIKNNVGIDPSPSHITDQDLTNNFFTVSTNVYSPLIDLVVQQTLDNTCADPVNGNTYSILVSNNGASPVVASPGAVVVTDNIPTGFVVNSASGTGWSVAHSGNAYTFTRGDALGSGLSYPPIQIKVHPAGSGPSWVNTASVTYPVEFNTTNNSSSVTMYTQLAAPAAPGPVTYCQGDAASPLTATGASLLWYNIPVGGAGSPTAPTPGTSTPGSTTYYVSQSNGTCGSVLSSIVVTVNPRATIALSSAPATTSQVVTVNTLITPITYTVGGSSTGATATGLPPGVTGAYNSGTFTISGKPTTGGPYSYTVTTTGGCSPASLGGTFSAITPLPVKLTDFTARADHDKVRLDWVTMIEANNTGFEIDRSADGQTWNKTGFEQSEAINGNSSTPLSYTFYDNTPLTGMNYYRLKQIDLDGQADYSTIQTVSFDGNGKITVSPNPANTVVTIKGVSAGQMLRLLDLNGKIVKERTVTGEREDLPLDQLANGSYILQVSNNGKVMETIRLLKIRP